MCSIDAVSRQMWAPVFRLKDGRRFVILTADMTRLDTAGGARIAGATAAPRLRPFGVTYAGEMVPSNAPGVKVRRATLTPGPEQLAAGVPECFVCVIGVIDEPVEGGDDADRA